MAFQMYSYIRKPLRAFDGLAVAAHAIALGIILVTNNPEDFESYLQLKIGLRN